MNRSTRNIFSQRIRAGSAMLPVLALCVFTFATPSRAAWDPPTTAPTVPLPNIPTNTFKISDYGAVADGKTMNTPAIERAMDACDKAGGGTVVVPAGRFLTGPLVLSSKMNLHLDRDATLLFSNNFADYRNDRGSHDNLIAAQNCLDVAITGEGVIDGQGEPWWQAFNREKFGADGDPTLGHRPFLITVKNCTRVLVQGVTLTNSPMFHLAPGACRDVTIDGVTFIAPERAPNTDALDPSGWNYLIKNCTFDVGDDCIAIKASGRGSDDHLSCEDMFITNCTFRHGHGMSIGGQTPGGLRRLVVRDSTFEDTEAGIRMKAPRGIGGLVEDCLYENLTMKNVKTPIYITSYYPERSTPRDPATEPIHEMTERTPIWRSIRINNVTSEGSPVAGKIIGVPESLATDITLTNVKISADEGFTIWNAKGVHFIDSQITVKKGPAVLLYNATEITGLDTKTGKSN